jgi:hypothetical protein
MRARECLREERHNERGVSILLVAVGMVFVLGMAGLGVDLASLYVGRSQAQRAADAGALAGAQALVSSGCTTSLGPDISPGCQAIARQRAVTVGNANFVAGKSRYYKCRRHFSLNKHFRPPSQGCGLTRCDPRQPDAHILYQDIRHQFRKRFSLSQSGSVQPYGIKHRHSAIMCQAMAASQLRPDPSTAPRPGRQSKLSGLRRGKL